ncbi:hypothetical protein [Halorussus pelagicus]|uniref:hypothetical protein n=1 Tax=Halorussus pelagicus TaxID=2505977 RepID=UPI000FFBFD1A|nr:hypothetical protein [Halorussus pelagicus]
MWECGRGEWESARQSSGGSNELASMTENHKYQTPSKGANDWHIPINENFAALDSDVEIRDAAQNRSEYEPKQGAKFLATDSGERFIGDGSQWTSLPYPGSSDSTATSSPENYDGSRPLVSTGSISVSVGSGGDYDSIQAAIENEFPWLIRHKVNINVSDGSYDEHVVVPPYVANWTESPTQSSKGERVPITIEGNQSSPSNCQIGSFTVSGGVGTMQLRGFEFTSNTEAGGLDNESAHVANYHTDKLGLVNCQSGGSAKRFIIAYNGRVATRQTIDAGDGNVEEYVKVKNNGHYQTGGGSSVSGTATSNAYVVDNGIVHFNSHDDSTLTGNNGLVRQFEGPQNDGGFAYDEGNGRMWLAGEARGIVVKDTSTGAESEIVVTDGNVTANQI